MWSSIDGWFVWRDAGQAISPKSGGMPDRRLFTMSIAQSKLEAFFVEFPWLIDLLRGYIGTENLARRINRLAVERLDLEVLRYVPYHESSDDDLSLFRDTWWHRLFVLDDQGTLIREVEQNKKAPNPNFHLLHPLTWRHRHITLPGQLLIDALVTLGQDFGYVLSIQKTEDDKYYVIIYKLPKSFSLKTWIDELWRRETAAVRLENALVDWDGQTIEIRQEEAGCYACFPNITSSMVFAPTVEQALGDLVQKQADVLGLDIRVI